MDIFPRKITFDANDKNCGFKIKSLHPSLDDKPEEDVVILFKVRRSEEKFVDYSPKFGLIEPGKTQDIKIDWMSDDAPQGTKIVVKTLEIVQSEVKPSFEDSWNFAAEKNNQQIKKKLIEINRLENSPKDFDEFEETFEEVDFYELSSECKESSSSINDKITSLPLSSQEINSKSPEVVENKNSKSIRPVAKGEIKNNNAKGHLGNSNNLTSSPFDTEKLMSELELIDKKVDESYELDPQIQVLLTPRKLNNSNEKLTKKTPYSEGGGPPSSRKTPSNTTSSSRLLFNVIPTPPSSENLSSHKQKQKQIEQLDDSFDGIEEEEKDAYLLHLHPQHSSSSSLNYDTLLRSPPIKKSTPLNSSGPSPKYLNTPPPSFHQKVKNLTVDTVQSTDEHIDKDIQADSSNSNSNSNSPKKQHRRRSTVGCIKHPKETDEQFRLRQLIDGDVGVGVGDNLLDPATSNLGIDMDKKPGSPHSKGSNDKHHHHSSSPPSSSTPSSRKSVAFENERVSWQTLHLTDDVLYQSERIHWPKGLKSPNRRRSSVSTKKDPNYTGSVYSTMRKELEKDDDDLVSDFEIKLIKMADKTYQLESSGTSKSIVNIVEGFLEKLKKESSVNLPSDYCVVGTVSLTDNLGPVSMPIYLKGLANIENVYNNRGKNHPHFVDNISSLVISHTSLARITKQINMFKNLTQLDLSHNCIDEILMQIDLPNLKVLDISNNRLKSLDYLQSLTSLKELNASYNNLTTTHDSIHMIVSLGQSLNNINLSKNPVCEHLNYCSEMICVFPGIKEFDGRSILEFFTSAWKLHSKILGGGGGGGGGGSGSGTENLSFSGSFCDPSSLNDTAKLSQENTTFDCRLRRALVHKFKGLHRDDVMSFLSADNDKKKSISPSRHRANNQQPSSSSFTSASLSHSNTPHSRHRSLSKDSGGTSTSTTTSMSYLDEFLAKALSYEPQSVTNCFVPTKKPTEEVASYLKATKVSRSKRQSFLVTSRSWLPFKSMWKDDDDDHDNNNNNNSISDWGSKILNVSADSPSRYMEKTSASKSKRMSFISQEALQAVKVRQEQSPPKRPLSAGTIAYMSYTNTSKQKRKSFIDINKERASSAKLRARPQEHVPSYMIPTTSSKPKRMSFIASSEQRSSSPGSPHRKMSFIDVNIMNCTSSSRIEAKKRFDRSPKKSTASYMKPTTASRPKRLSYISPVSASGPPIDYSYSYNSTHDDATVKKSPGGSGGGGSSGNKEPTKKKTHSSNKQNVNESPTQSIYCKVNRTPFGGSPSSATTSPAPTPTTTTTNQNIPHKSSLSSLFGSVPETDYDSPPPPPPQQQQSLTQPAGDMNTSHYTDRALLPREMAMRPSQVSPKPQVFANSLQNLLGKKSNSFTLREDELFADLSD